ncbi:Phospholipase D/Transphosphatidylase [Pseudooceanicola batsensis HTCC2597]|uniref:Phospholipase D n=1 Tax=Pseudooceanicola batsensis (strain ATCC BAA-863 / DSM 15984 / KCTC 12145 / HTCC2597) TaxID=252305 RepID=A3TTW4_PSEBH|nr:Phospholipase D/Transphosphatidylase [Pseudooceanicola batsensis HTCC2597]
MKPLITAAEMYPALEEMILQARTEVLLAFRILDARTALRSKAAQEAGLTSWADLLEDAAERGVRVRLLLSDFDPVFTPDLHREAWGSAGRFAARLNAHPSAELICALHDCAPAPIWERVFSPQINDRLAELRSAPHEYLTRSQLRALDGHYRLRPVTLHQKFAVIDRERAVIGGIDIDERRFDDHDHDQRPEDTWHDVSMAVTGPVIAQIVRHFADCWDRSRAECGTVFSETVTDLPDIPEAGETDPDAPDLLRTVSSHLDQFFRFGPVTDVKEHETAHFEAFAQAEHSIYIETQFFRHMPLARALARRAAEVPDLQLILVTPTEPERVIFGRDNGMDARHAQALQLRCLAHLRKAFGDRIAVVSPVQPRPAPDGTPMPLAGSAVIYLHSKVTLIDESVGIVGSANLNGRSLLWDTEASVRFREADAIRHLRQRLARKWLGSAPGDPEMAATWTSAARVAAAAPPEERRSMILPYPVKRNRRFARYVPILPAAMF